MIWCVTPLEPAAVERPGALPNGAEPQPPGVPAPSSAGETRPALAQPLPLRQEEDPPPRGEHGPHQVSLQEPGAFT